MTSLNYKNHKTSETGKTDWVDNQSFLEIVFGNKVEGACPIVVSFKGSPNTIARNKWFGRPWTMGDQPLELDPNANNYFSLSTYSFN